MRKHRYFLKAICCLAAAAVMGTMSAAAAEQSTDSLKGRGFLSCSNIWSAMENSGQIPLVEGEGGSAVLCGNFPSSAVLVVADRKVLEEQDPFESRGTDYDWIHLVNEDYEQMLSAWDAASQERIRALGEDVVFYQVLFHPNRTFRHGSVGGRRLMLDTPGILDVLVYDEDCTATVKWVGSLSMGFTEQGDALSDAELAAWFAEHPEIESIWDETHAQGLAWVEAVEAWEKTVDLSAMTPAEINRARHAQGLPTDYEMMQYAYAQADRILEIGGEYLSGGGACLSGVPYDFTVERSGETAWKHVGDLNGDGAVNASDAALLLTAAAKDGAGSDCGLDETAQLWADVNADTRFDASDAAAILRYAAATGGSFGGTLAEYLCGGR